MLAKCYYAILIGVIFISAANCGKKTANYWIQRFEMSPVGSNGPYMSSPLPYGNLTENLPSGYPSGVTRKTGSGNYALFKPGNRLFPFYKFLGIDFLHHLRGGTLDVYIINPNTGELTKTRIGARKKDDGFTVFVEAGFYCAWKLHDRNQSEDFSLVAVTSIPEYRLGDDTTLTREFLLDTFPRHEEIIKELTLPTN